MVNSDSYSEYIPLLMQEVTGRIHVAPPICIRNEYYAQLCNYMHGLHKHALSMSQCLVDVRHTLKPSIHGEALQCQNILMVDLLLTLLGYGMIGSHSDSISRANPSQHWPSNTTIYI